MWAPENLSNDGTVAGISEGGMPCIDAEIVEGCQNRVPISLGSLSVILG